jgi:hypothetical protein
MSKRTGAVQDFSGARLTSVGTPTTPTDAVNRQFIRYDWPTGCVGKPNPGEIFPYFLVPVPFTIPATMTGSRSRCIVAPAASVTWTLNRINSAGSTTQIATLNFAAGATSGTFTMSSATSIVDGDLLYWSAPSNQDANMSDISITVAGIRTA